MNCRWQYVEDCWPIYLLMGQSFYVFSPTGWKLPFCYCIQSKSCFKKIRWLKLLLIRLFVKYFGPRPMPYKITRIDLLTNPPNLPPLLCMVKFLFVHKHPVDWLFFTCISSSRGLRSFDLCRQSAWKQERLLL